MGKEVLVCKFKYLKLDFEDSVEWLVKFLRFFFRVELYFCIVIGVLFIFDFFKRFEVFGNKLVEVVEDKVVEVDIKVFEFKILCKGFCKVNGMLCLMINGEFGDCFYYIFVSCCNLV